VNEIIRDRDFLKKIFEFLRGNICISFGYYFVSLTIENIMHQSILEIAGPIDNCV
jgi:hypothetical protein